MSSFPLASSATSFIFSLRALISSSCFWATDWKQTTTKNIKQNNNRRTPTFQVLSLVCRPHLPNLYLHSFWSIGLVYQYTLNSEVTTWLALGKTKTHGKIMGKFHGSLTENATIHGQKSFQGRPAVKFTFCSQLSLAFSNIVKIPWSKRRGTYHSVGIELFELPVLINQRSPVFLPLLGQVHKSLCTRIHNTLQ